MSHQQHAGGHRPLGALLAGLARLVHDSVIHVAEAPGALARRRRRAGAARRPRASRHRPYAFGDPCGRLWLCGGRANGPACQDTAGDQPVPAKPAETAALVRELSDHLLRASTATEALRTWCAARGLSAGPITAVKQDTDQRRYPDDDTLEGLRPKRHERVAYRCVRLVRGLVVLSEADNWFVPERLPPEVRRRIGGDGHALRRCDRATSTLAAHLLREVSRTEHRQRSRDRWLSSWLFAIDADPRAQGRRARSKPAAAFRRIRTLLRCAPERRRDALSGRRRTRIGWVSGTAISAVSRLEGDRKDEHRWFRTGSPGPARRGSCARNCLTPACGTNSASDRTTW